MRNILLTFTVLSLFGLPGWARADRDTCDCECYCEPCKACPEFAEQCCDDVDCTICAPPIVNLECPDVAVVPECPECPDLTCISQKLTRAKGCKYRLDGSVVCRSCVLDRVAESTIFND